MRLQTFTHALVLALALSMSGGCGDDEPGPIDSNDDTQVTGEDAADPVEDTTPEPVDDAGPTETLKTGGPFTAFAPTDAAITQALESLGMSVEEFVGDTDLLTSVLTYHVVEGTVPAADVVTLTSATTLQGSDIAIEIVDGGVVLNGSINVTATDVMASNGIIHVIDGVLMPPN